MTLVQTDDGRVGASLDLDALTGEELLTALDPLCRPIPLPDGSPDPRPAGKRRADALGQRGAHLPVQLTAPHLGGVLPTSPSSGPRQDSWTPSVSPGPSAPSPPT